MSIFEEIKTGLNQAIEYEKGHLKTKKTTVEIVPLDSFSSNDIRNIRKNAQMTQSLFAKYMGVSIKTVEAWESGTNHPNGSASRLLAITRDNPDFPHKVGIIVRKTTK